MKRSDTWDRTLRVLPVLVALLPVLIAAGGGRLPRLPGFGLGVFVAVLIAIWLPRTWPMFWILVGVNALGAAAYGIAAHLAPHLWLATGFIAVVGYAGGWLTLRLGALVALLPMAGACCGLNAPAASANQAALILSLGGLWSIICALAFQRPPAPPRPIPPPPVSAIAIYPLRCALILGAATAVGHWLWPAHPGWTPVAAAAVVRLDLTVTRQRSIGRLAATFGAGLLSCLLLALHGPPLPNLLFLSALMVISLWLGLDPAYANPFVATTLVLTLLA